MNCRYKVSARRIGREIRRRLTPAAVDRELEAAVRYDITYPRAASVAADLVRCMGVVFYYPTDRRPGARYVYLRCDCGCGSGTRIRVPDWLLKFEAALPPAGVVDAKQVLSLWRYGACAA